MRFKKYSKQIVISVFLLTGIDQLCAQTPHLINYQGRIAVGNANFDGTGQFKFALVNGDGSTVYWGNAVDISPADGVPDSAVSLTVTKGLYSVLLGETAAPLSMTALLPSVFSNADVRLRVWFNDGTNGFQLLTPDQRIAAVGYAMMADNVTDGSITAAKIAAGAVGTNQLAANAVEAGNIAGGAVGSAQIANGAVGTNQIADGTITAAKLLKPVRTGSIGSSSISFTALGGSFTVPFNPPFNVTPNVTLSLLSADGSNSSTARVYLTSTSKDEFSATVVSGNTSVILDVGTSIVGDFLAHAVVAGNPAICYYDRTNRDLKYIRALDASGTFWGAPITVDSVDDVGSFASMAIVSGNPAISYYDATNDDLLFVRASNTTGTSWLNKSKIIDSTGNVGQYTSLAIVNGNPAISYQDVTNGDLKYVRATNSSASTWGIPVTLDSTDNVGRDTSLVVINGNPAISYYDTTNGDLKYLRAIDDSGTTWGTPLIVDSTDNVGSYTSLAMINGNPAISYYDDTNDDLNYVRATDADGTAWGTPQILDSTGSVGLHTSLKIVDGNPAISYYDSTNGNLKFRRATDASGTTWAAASNVESAGNVGRYSALMVVNGNPAISFLDDTNGSPSYVRAGTVTGTSWSDPLLLDQGNNGDVGQYTSQAIVNGHPAISYYDVTNGDLKYVRATDPGGTSWGAPMTLDSTGNVGLHSSLAVINGNPAICYRDDTNDDLKYIRANDINGITWGTPVVAVNNSAQYPSLMMVTGFYPAISYYNDFSGDLLYLVAADVNGTSWNSEFGPSTLDSIGNVGEYSCQKMVNGRPAVCYYDRSNGNLKYVSSTNNQGLGWGTPMTIDNSVDNVGIHPSLEIINGNPAISYYNDTTDDLKFIRGNPTGSSWGSPITLDSASNVGQFSSLAVINGNPAITYLRDDGFPSGSGRSLRYVQSLNPDGTSWATSVTLDVTPGVGQFASMASLNGTASISYYNSVNGELKYLRLIDASNTGTTLAPFVINWMALEP